MPVEFVDFEAARDRAGLRMVVVPGVPSPWGEAAKGILHVKGIPWVAVKLDTRNRELVEWMGCESGPVVVYEQEAPRSGWAEILLLCERLAPEPALLPTDAADRALVMGLTHEICESLPRGYAELRGQLFRSGCAVVLLVAEGANRRTKGMKRQRFVEAQGECGEACATVELLGVLGVVTRQTRERYDQLANHVSALLSGLVKTHSCGITLPPLTPPPPHLALSP